MPQWLSASQSAAISKAVGVCVGSSTTQGQGASVRAQRYENLLDTKLRSRANITSDTHDFYPFSPDGSSYSTTGTVTTGVFSGTKLQTWQLAQNATVSITAPAKIYTIWFTQGVGSGTFSAQINGGAPVTITPNTGLPAGTHTGSVDIDAGSYGNHTLKITADNACELNGVETHSNRNDRGYYIYNFGLSGTQSGDYLNVPHMIERINAVQPKFLLNMIGSNDYFSQVAPATYKSRTQTFINAIRAGVPSNPDILLVQPYKRFDVTPTSYTWDVYGSVLRQLAAENSGCYFLDISASYPDSQALDAANLIGADDVHQTDAGYSHMARLILPTLI